MADKLRVVLEVLIKELADLDRERLAFALGVTAFLRGILLSLTFSIWIKALRGVLGADVVPYRVVLGSDLNSDGDLDRIVDRDLFRD